MILSLLRGALTLLGLGNWVEKLWGDHQLKEQGKTEQRLDDALQAEKEQAKDLSDVQKANDFESRIIADSTLCERVRLSTNVTASGEG